MRNGNYWLEDIRQRGPSSNSVAALMNAIRDGHATLGELGITQEDLDGWKKQAELSSAIEWVESIRESGPRDNNVAELARAISTGAATLEELGITQHQLDEWKKAGDLVEARSWLESIRGSGPNTNNVAVLARAIQAGEATLEELGITQEDLDGWKKQAELSLACWWLEDIRQSGPSSNSVAALSNAIRDGHATLGELGITQGDLDGWKKQADLSSAIEWLEIIRERGPDWNSVAALANAVRAGGATLEELGITQEDLDGWSKEADLRVTVSTPKTDTAFTPDIDFERDYGGGSFLELPMLVLDWDEQYEEEPAD